MHQVRYAHCEGYTDVCFTDKGSFLTTGEDGDVRIWQGFDDLDNTSIRVGDKCFSIAYKNGKIYVADDLNEVKKYDLATNELEGVITSFTLSATCICINKSDTSLVLNYLTTYTFLCVFMIDSLKNKGVRLLWLWHTFGRLEDAQIHVIHGSWRAYSVGLLWPARKVLCVVELRRHRQILVRANVQHSQNACQSASKVKRLSRLAKFM